jgi:hypothetical protein
MTRKHFQAIAEVLRDLPAHPTPEKLTKALAGVLPSGLKTRFVTEVVADLPVGDAGQLVMAPTAVAHAFARSLNATNDYFDSGRFVAVATGQQPR